MGNKNTEKKKRRLARKKIATQEKDKECPQCGEFLSEINTYSTSNTVCKYCERENVERDISCYFD